MADNYRTPGVYIEEVPHLPPSIASVETAVPAFIGYTQFAKNKLDKDLLHVPWQIESMLEYQQYFGFAQPEPGITVTIDESQTPIAVTATVDETARSQFLMYYSLESFFLNGGSLCYIVSVGDYTNGINLTDLNEKADGTGGLDVIKQVIDITLIVFPDAMNLTGADAAANYYSLHETAMLQCSILKNRFTVMDMFRASNNWKQDKILLRGSGTSPANLSGTIDTLKYGAVYFPRIKTNIQFSIMDPNTGLDIESLVKISLNGTAMTLDKLKTANNKYYNLAKNAYQNNLEMLLPASSAMVGIYALVDNARGVWKAPANLSIIGAIDLEEKITDLDQDDLNVDTTNGLSINAIRSFPRGAAIVWGARTLAGNDNEWRYISVRRLFIMLEQSIRNASEQFVFEPNDENTWVRVKSMIEIYLTEQWKAGALMGTSTKQAFYVHIGLGQTMSEVDVWEGRMIIEIGIAPVRPAEFIILRFIQKMLDES
jgi:Bacteriophage tail sheath protein